MVFRLLKKQSPARRLLKMLILLIASAGFLYFIFGTPLGKDLSQDQIPNLRARLELAGSAAWLGYIFIGTLMVAAGLPRSIYCLLGGALFDFWAGFAWSMIGSLTGSYAGFAIIRWIGRDWLDRRWGKKYDRLKYRLRQEGFIVVLLSRLCPATNNFLVNSLAGISSVRSRSFIVASLMGFLPSSAIFVLMGSGVAVANSTRLLISAILFTAATIGTLMYYHRSGLAHDIWQDLMAGGANRNDESTLRNNPRS
jgi:uncharacterized membrane protein YdjX (TVP38/TMEM64 family)